MESTGTLPRVGVVGTGLIGASIGMASRAAGFAVAGWDPSADALGTAAERGAIDTAAESLDVLLADADLVVVATPPSTVEAVLGRILGSVAPHVAVTDVTSTKSHLTRLAEQHPRYVPGHPMAGSERHGPEHASPALFRGAVWPLCPVVQTDLEALSLVGGWVRALGAVPLPLDPKVQDAAVAITSHLPHVLAFLLYRQALDADLRRRLPVFELAAGGFHSATRVAASSPEAWSAILSANSEAVIGEIERLEAALATVKDCLAAADSAGLHAVLREGLRHPDVVVRYPAEGGAADR
jgi:prephenate dehydrogenase